MQVITADRIVIDYSITKHLPQNPSIEQLNRELKFAERLVDDREKWLSQSYIDLELTQSDLNRTSNDLNRKRVKEKEGNIEYTLHNLKVEKEDLKALQEMITEKEWDILCKNKSLVKQVSMF